MAKTVLSLLLFSQVLFLELEEFMILAMMFVLVCDSLELLCMRLNKFFEGMSVITHIFLF